MDDNGWPHRGYVMSDYFQSMGCLKAPNFSQPNSSPDTPGSEKCTFGRVVCNSTTLEQHFGKIFEIKYAYQSEVTMHHIKEKCFPQEDLGKEGLILINFFNFAKGEPNIFKYDLTSCYNDSYSKLLVLTFPGIELLRGSEKLIGLKVHLAIQNVTGISKQRIFINEVVFVGKYMYTEFDILEAPFVTKSKEISLEDAVKKLKNLISSRNFAVKILVDKQIVVLEPEPNGLNIFSGGRNRSPSVIGYKEGSVISLTIGMLILGFLLGIVTLNLVMSRKFGVSLFKKSTYGNAPFSNSLNESSM